MLAFSRATGKLLWETHVPSTGVEHVYWKNSHASATPTTDGERVYASFGTHGLAAFDFSGKIVWHTKLGDLGNYHGSAGSPVLYKDRIFLYQDHDGTATLGSFVAAFDAKTGQGALEARPQRRPVGWGTPIVIHAGDRDELIVSSQRRVNAYNPDTGEELWTVRGNRREVIPTPVVGHGLVFCSSGRAGPTFAIRPGGKGDVTATHVAWSHRRKDRRSCRQALVHGDLLYLVNDMQSILTVYEAKTGKLVYQERLGEPIRGGLLGLARGRRRQAVLHQRRRRDVRRPGRADVQAAARQRPERAGPRVAGARRRHVVLADGQGTAGDQVDDAAHQKNMKT